MVWQHEKLDSSITEEEHRVLLQRLNERYREMILHLYTRLDVDGGDLFDDLRGRVQVDDALVDSHLEFVPSLGTLT